MPTPHRFFSRWLRAAAAAAALLFAFAGAPAGAQSGDPPRLGVLPFRVHSAKPIEYLGESLANLLRTSLESSGRVRVLDPSDVAAELDPVELRETRDGALRASAGRLGADWLVTGSLTELAGRYSLDVRATPAAAGLDALTLVVTAQREEQLLERVGELSESIVEQVVGTTPPVVTSVTIAGAGERIGELLPQLGSRAGEPYDPATVRDDLALLRADPSVRSASVETERGPEGVGLRFRVRRGISDVQGANARQAVSELRVRGNRRIESAAILARVSTQVGGRLDVRQIGADVREINGLGFFRHVRVFTEPTDAGYVVIFEVEENPIVRQVEISGNENLESDKIRDILTLTTGSTLDYPLLFENRARIAALYRAQGYYLAEVSYEVESLSEHAVGIHFVVDENEKLKLREIRFTGNEHFDDGELTEDFQTKRWRFWSYATSWFDRSGTYSEPLFHQDLQTIQKRYADAGFIQAEIGDPEVIPSDDGLEVVVHIVEGDRYDVGSIAIAGDSSVDVDELKEMLLLKEGEVFNRTYLTESVDLLSQYYTDRGFYFASVQPVSNLSDEDLVIDVIFQVRKGPLYFIREIDVSGNTTTIDPVVRREMALVEGQLYSSRLVALSRARVHRTGYFEEVDVRMEPTEAPQQLDMEVHVVERPTGSFSFGAGFSSQDGLVATGSLQQSNLFGRGYAVNASVDFGGQTQRFFLNVTDPYFLGSEWSLGVTGFRTRVNFESFEQDQIGAEIAFGRALTQDKRTRGSLRYNYSSRKIVDDSRRSGAAVILREFEQGAIDSSMFGVTLTSDTRNDFFAPNDGHVLGGSVQWAGPPAFAEFLKFEGRAVFFLGAPRWLLPRSSFVAGLRMGYALPFNDVGDYDLPAGSLDTHSSLVPLDQIDTDIELPLSERYILGGLGQFQLRGFQARSVGPLRPVLLQDRATGNFYPLGKTLTTLHEDTGAPVDPGDPFATPGAVCNVSVCNEVEEVNDFRLTDVVGGNKFITASLEYRFPISETLGLQGVAFFDTGNAFAEGENLFDVTEWRYGTGAGLQWFSPFGPLAIVLGFPLDPIKEIEDSPVFEFSVGGREF